MEDVGGVRREVRRIVRRGGRGLAQRRYGLVRSLPGSGLRREGKEGLRLFIPSHDGPAQYGCTERELVDVSADLDACFVQAPGLEDVRYGSAPRRDRVCLEQ